jgi:mycofactocin precursor
MDHAPTAVPDLKSVSDLEEGSQHAEQESSEVLVEEDSLVEEVSIDGMCGVY